MMLGGMKIELFARRNLFGLRRWYFRIVAGNGKIIAQSEAYSRKVDCRSTAHLIQDGARFAEIVEGK